MNLEFTGKTNYNLQHTTHNLQPKTYNLQPALN